MRRSGLERRIADLEQRQRQAPPARRAGVDFESMSDDQLDQWLASYQPPPPTPRQEAWSEALHAADDATLDRVLAWQMTGAGPDPLGPAVAAILQRKGAHAHR